MQRQRRLLGVAVGPRPQHAQYGGTCTHAHTRVANTGVGFSYKAVAGCPAQAGYTRVGLAGATRGGRQAGTSREVHGAAPPALLRPLARHINSEPGSKKGSSPFWYMTGSNTASIESLLFMGPAEDNQGKHRVVGIAPREAYHNSAIERVGHAHTAGCPPQHSPLPSSSRSQVLQCLRPYPLAPTSVHGQRGPALLGIIVPSLHTHPPTHPATAPTHRHSWTAGGCSSWRQSSRRRAGCRSRRWRSSSPRGALRGGMGRGRVGVGGRAGCRNERWKGGDSKLPSGCAAKVELGWI